MNVGMNIGWDSNQHHFHCYLAGTTKLSSILNNFYRGKNAPQHVLSFCVGIFTNKNLYHQSSLDKR